MNRQHREKHTSFRKFHIQTGGVFCKIPMGKHNPLTLSGSTGGKENRSQLIRLQIRPRTSSRFHLLQCHFHQLRQSQDAISIFCLLHGNKITKLWTLDSCCFQHIFSCFICHQNHCICTVDKFTDICSRKGCIQRYCHTSTVHRSKIGQNPLIGSRTNQCHMPASDLQCFQKIRKMLAVFSKIRITFLSNRAFS